MSLLSYGARLQSWQVAHQSDAVNVVLGHDAPAAYLTDPHSMGILAGRVANRISGAALGWNWQRYVLDANELPNTLHGGRVGFGQRHWALEQDGPRGAVMHLVSEHGDMGFPGRVEVTVQVTLTGGTLSYDIMAMADRPTPVNLAHHAYWNLMGQGDVLGHRVAVAADNWTPVGPGLIPTGQIEPLTPALTALKTGKMIGEATEEGCDMNYVLDQGHAQVDAPNGLRLTVATDQPCLQFYTGHKLTAPFRPFGGLCLEPQGYIDAVNAGFPVAIAGPDTPYRQISSFTIGAA
ncbi:MAG: galactose mutarotase [Rhodobacteraceae bacterium]|nr:galactose mutarotase [Paracoccaceae bacterium]